MALLQEIIPTAKQRLIDLVAEAGVDISDWANFKRGPAYSASNPKYCYEWAFEEKSKVAVLCLWYPNMIERGGSLVQELNLRDRAAFNVDHIKASIWHRRAKWVEQVVSRAFRNSIHLRVIVCDGELRDVQDPEARASKVERRLLDPKPWVITHYDQNTGTCTLVRDAEAMRFTDQFDADPQRAGLGAKREVTGEVYVRDPAVRRRVLARANGRCEWCGMLGFLTSKNEIYLETHHIIPLSEGGADTDSNVVAICPNHHREAHFAKGCRAMRDKLQQRAQHPIQPYTLS